MNLKEVLDSVMATYAPVTEAQGVDVQVLIEQNASLELWADRDLLEQVVGNLFRNALQALEGSRNTVHPRVCWRVGNAENGQLWLRIEDNGSGVSESIKNRLFKPFVTSRAQGTGLGLSFVKKVLEDHQGSIRYVDALPSLGGEQGAVFELILPLFHREEEGAIHAEMDLQDFIQKEVSLHVENSIGR